MNGDKPLTHSWTLLEVWLLTLHQVSKDSKLHISEECPKPSVTMTLKQLGRGALGDLVSNCKGLNLWENNTCVANEWGVIGR